MLTISFICPFYFLSDQIFYYRFLGFCESQSLQISYSSWEWPSQVYCGTENQDAEIYFYHLFPFFLFFFHLSLQCNTFWKFVSKISQELLRLGLWNLVQMLGLTRCIVYKRISMLLLIIPFICPFFFLSNKTFRHIILSSYYCQSL